MLAKNVYTFLKVAECGSFTKASDSMYISPTALIKQIDNLENDWGIKLFDRGARGVSLTDAGQYLYEEAKKSTERWNSVHKRALEIAGQRQTTIRIGVSLMDRELDLSKEICAFTEQYPDLQIQAVPFKNDTEDFMRLLNNLGKEVDVFLLSTAMPYVYDYADCVHLFDLPTCVAVSKSHRLAGYEKLKTDDMSGETLYMPRKGMATDSDAIRRYLAGYPSIRIADVDDYGYEVYNRVCSVGGLLLCAKCWTALNPMLVALPVEWDFTIPYGLIFSKELTATVKLFISFMAEVFAEGTER